MNQAVKDIMEILLRFHWRERIWILKACAKTVAIVEVLRGKQSARN